MNSKEITYQTYEEAMIDINKDVMPMTDEEWEALMSIFDEPLTDEEYKEMMKFNDDCEINISQVHFRKETAERICRDLNIEELLKEEEE